MHARPVAPDSLRLALAWAFTLALGGSPAWGRADDPVSPPAPKAKATPTPKASRPAAAAAAGATPKGDQGLPPLPGEEASKAQSGAATGSAPGSTPAPVATRATPVPAPITPGSLTECKQAEMGIGSRRAELGKPSDKDTPTVRTVREVLDRREALVREWRAENEQRLAAEHPEPNPEQVAAGFRDELARTRTLLDQLAKTPDALLPEAFRPPVSGSAPAKTLEARLAEMKEALDAARQDIAGRSSDPEKASGDAAGKLALPAPVDLAKLRADRDKSQQALAALLAARAEREAALNAAGAPEARDLARDRYTNFEWEYRVEAERLAADEAQIHRANREAEARTLMAQSREARLGYDRKLVELMERLYTAQSEQQQRALEQARSREETRAALTADVLERYRAKRTAELLELEAQTVAYEKALATSHGEHQKELADKTVREFEKLKKLLGDGSVSPLDVLTLKTAFRWIGPERAAIVRNVLAPCRAEATSYENALADAEVDLINDARDDRYDREALLDKLPEARHAAAVVVLDEMEARHLALLNRRRDVLKPLAERAERTQGEIRRRIQTLDDEYAFIRTHIFWVRDAEPVGPATLGHARVEAARTLRALVRIAGTTVDRSQWGRVSVDFIVAVLGLVVLPWPLHLGRRALDRRRVARRHDAAAAS